MATATQRSLFNDTDSVVELVAFLEGRTILFSDADQDYNLDAAVDAAVELVTRRVFSRDQVLDKLSERASEIYGVPVETVEYAVNERLSRRLMGR